LQDQLGKAFADKFEKKYNAPVSGTAAVTYDAVHIFAQAAIAAGGPDDKKAVAAAVKKTPFRGVCGARDFSFDPDQTARPYPAFTKDDTRGMPTGYFQIQDGKSLLVDPSPYNTAKFVLPGWMKA
jgi:branched-chain amino acid transport system substrate-binding protein